MSEELRLQTLHQHAMFHTTADRLCDDVLALAACLCEVPFTAITLLDSDKQYFKSAIGINVKSGPREHSFCTHAIQRSGVTVVENMLTDPRFQQNPYVVNRPNIRFYAGAPLIAENGAALGTLCALDIHPHSLTQTQREGLEVLAHHLIWSFSQFENPSMQWFERQKYSQA